jgi:hypothetical protein
MNWKSRKCFLAPRFSDIGSCVGNRCARTVASRSATSPRDSKSREGARWPAVDDL